MNQHQRCGNRYAILQSTIIWWRALVTALPLTLCLLLPAQPASRGRALPTETRQLVMDTVQSQIALKGEPLRVIPGDIVAVTLKGPIERQITSYQCTWETEESGSGFFDPLIGKKTKVPHKETATVQGSLATEIALQWQLPEAVAIRILGSDATRDLATFPGALAFTGTADRTLQTKPNGGNSNCVEVQPVPTLTFDVAIDITRFDH